MIVRAEQRRSFDADGAIAERRAFRATRNDANVL